MQGVVDPFDIPASHSTSSGPAKSAASCAPEDMAKLIKETIMAQMAAWQGNVSSLVKDALDQALDPIQKGLAENGEMLKSVSAQLGDHAVKFDALSTRLDSVETSVRKSARCNDDHSLELIKMQKKLNELEDRSRLNNVRLVGLPAGAEGDDPRAYLQNMLPKWIPTLKSRRNAVVTVDKAHRIYTNNKNPGPRTMIFRLLHFPDRQAILDGAKKNTPTGPNGSKLLFFADYSPGTTKARRSFKEIRTALWQRRIESFLVYPAILKVNYKGKRMTFDTAEEAKQKLSFLDDPVPDETRRDNAVDDGMDEDDGGDGTE